MRIFYLCWRHTLWLWNPVNFFIAIIKLIPRCHKTFLIKFGFLDNSKNYFTFRILFFEISSLKHLRLSQFIGFFLCGNFLLEYVKRIFGFLKFIIFFFNTICARNSRFSRFKAWLTKMNWLRILSSFLIRRQTNLYLLKIFFEYFLLPRRIHRLWVDIALDFIVFLS